MKGAIFKAVFILLTFQRVALSQSNGYTVGNGRIGGFGRFLSEEVNAGLVDDLEKKSFNLLLNDSSTFKAPKSFLDFPEAQLITQEKIENDQQQLKSFVESKTLPNPSQARIQLKRRRRRNRSLKSIKLNDDLEDFLPDFSKSLEALKPLGLQKQTRSYSDSFKGTDTMENGVNEFEGPKGLTKPVKLPLKGPCTEADQLAGKCKLLDLVPDQKNIESTLKSTQQFESFKKDVTKHVKTSNRKVRNQYRQLYMEETQIVEQNYQSFLLFATDRYKKLQNISWRTDLKQYRFLRNKAQQEKIKSIQNNIKLMVKRLIQFYNKKWKSDDTKRLQDLKKDLITIQQNYNDAYTRDQTQANQLTSKVDDERLNIWANKEKDQQYIDQELLEHL